MCGASFTATGWMEARHWTVLEQDRVMMEAMEPDANQREHLYEHDAGLVRLRRHLRGLAEKELAAAQVTQKAA